MTTMTTATVKMPVSRTWQAAGIASCIEALLFLTVVVVIRSLPPATPTFMPLVIEPLAEEIKPAPKVKPEPPKPVEPVKPVPVVSHSEPKPLPRIEPVIERRAEPVVVSEPVFEQPAPPPPKPQQEAAEDPAIAYNAALTMAVQAAFKVPAAATTLGFKGRARVEFKLQDGHVSASTLLESSTLGLVDRAALRAVNEASYPSPPAALAGIMRTYQIWVECR